MDQDGERFVEQVSRAMEFGAILEDIGLAADGGYERLLVDQWVLYGRSDDEGAERELVQAALSEVTQILKQEETP